MWTKRGKVQVNVAVFCVRFPAALVGWGDHLVRSGFTYLTINIEMWRNSQVEEKLLKKAKNIFNHQFVNYNSSICEVVIRSRSAAGISPKTPTCAHAVCEKRTRMLMLTCCVIKRILWNFHFLLKQVWQISKWTGIMLTWRPR